MFNLSPRLPDYKTQTSELLGPTTYIIRCDTTARKNTVPFCSSAVRKSAAKKSLCNTLYIVPNTKKVTGCSTPKNKSPRFKDRLDETPGPTDYDPVPVKCKKIDPTPPKGKGRLIFCRTPLSYGVSAPTIPTRIDQNGYDVDHYGDITKIPLEKHDTTLGPAYYNTLQEPECECDIYKGCHWSLSKTERFNKKIEDIPGPGTYELVISENEALKRDEEYREMARLYSFLPRYSELQEIRMNREHCPGPADYYTEACPKKCKPSRAIKEKPFITQSRRFKLPDEESPAPTTYNVVRSEIKKCCPGKFGASRFSNKKNVEIPAPGTYEIKSAFDSKSRSKFPFNQSSLRNMAYMTDADLPALNQYSLSEGKCKESIPSSVFNSKTKFRREFCKLPFVEDDSDLTKAFLSTKASKSHNKKRPGFNIKEKRKHLVKKGPWPGKYDTYMPDMDKGHRFPREHPRFKDVTNGVPGPQNYSLPTSQDASFKAYYTHNIRLKENVLRRKLRLTCAETFKAWCEQLNADKSLRWFQDGGIDYQHC